MLTNQETLPFTNWNTHFTQLDLAYSQSYSALFCNMHPTRRPSFTPELLADLHQYQTQLAHFLERHEAQSPNNDFIKYVIHTSTIPNIWNLGGDLGRFAQLIRAQDRDHLMQYATACIGVLYTNHVNMHSSNITTIALLNGTAAGGGFEAALSNDIIIAEKGVEMGFPEAIFNLFPGMGAYSFLARRISPVQAEKIIKSGRMYSAEDMHEIGIVDVLAEPGEAHIELQRFIQGHRKYANMHHAMGQVKSLVNPVTYQELEDVVKIWVDAAMQLPETNIRTMERLVKAQDRRMSKQTTLQTKETPVEHQQASA